MELHKMVQNYLPANKEYPWENRKDMKRAEQLLWEYSGGGRCELDKLMRRMIENDRRMEQKRRRMRRDGGKGKILIQRSC